MRSQARQRTTPRVATQRNGLTYKFVFDLTDLRSGVVGVRRIEAAMWSCYAALTRVCFSRAHAAVSRKVCIGVLPKHQRPWCVRCSL